MQPTSTQPKRTAPGAPSPNKPAEQPARVSSDREPARPHAEKVLANPGSAAPNGAVEERRIAPRVPKALVPSITGLRLSPVGGEMSLVNISASGVALKGNTRPGLGTPVTLNLEGTFTPSSIKGRVVRCLVAAIQAGVVWYHIGIAFDAPIPLEGATDVLNANAHPPAPAPPPPLGSANPAILFNRW